MFNIFKTEKKFHHWLQEIHLWEECLVHGHVVICLALVQSLWPSGRKCCEWFGLSYVHSYGQGDDEKAWQADRENHSTVGKLSQFNANWIKFSPFLNKEDNTNFCSKLNRGTIMMILVNYHEFFSRLFNRLRSLTSYPAFPSSEKLPLTLSSLNALKLKQQKPLVIFQIIHSVFDSFSPSTYHFSHSKSKSYLP